MDLSKLSTEDLQALRAGDLSKVSTAGLRALRGEGPQASAKKKTSNLAQDAAAGVLRGAGSIGATLLTPIDAVARALGIQNDYIGRTDRREAMTAALGDAGFDTSSTAFGAGKLGGEIAGTLGVGGLLGLGAKAAGAGAPMVNAFQTAGMVTKANPVGVGARAADMATRAAAGAGTGLASAALVDPGDQQGMAIGGVLGGALPPAVKGAGLLGNALTRKSVGAAGERAALAQSAINQGIPLSAADVSANPVVRAIRSVLDDVPVIGRPGARSREAVQEGFNRAVGRTFGADATRLTPEVMDKARGALGAEFDRIWNNNALQVDGTMIQKVIDLQKVAAKLPKGEGGSLTAELDDLLSKVTTDAAGNPVIPGDVANKFQSYLRRRAEGSSGLRNELGDLRQTIIAAFNRSVSPADAAALTGNRAAYKAFKTVEPILTKAELGVAGREVGNVAPELLPGAVMKSYGPGASKTELGNLSQIGSQFVADRVMRTGGSARAAVQNSALGTALTLGGWQNPLIPALGIPAATLLERALASPAAGRALAGLPSEEAAPLLLNLYRAAPALAADR